MASSGSQRRAISHGRKRALKQLERSYEGPIRGLQIAPEFFQLLQSPELRDTPLGASLQAQMGVFEQINAALQGRTPEGGSAGTLPPDLVSAISEGLGSAQAARGTAGSPAGALEAAMRFSGASEQIREARINQALNAINTIGAGALFPSAQQFLGVGQARASQAANIEFQAGQLSAQAIQNAQAQNAKLVGTLVGGAVGGIAGGVGALGTLGLSGGFGGAVGGFGLGTGLLPPSLFTGGGTS